MFPYRDLQAGCGCPPGHHADEQELKSCRSTTWSCSGWQLPLLWTKRQEARAQSTNSEQELLGTVLQTEQNQGDFGEVYVSLLWLPKNYSVIKEALSEILLILKDQQCMSPLNTANFSSTKRPLCHSVLMALSTAMHAAGPSEPCEDTWWMGPTTPSHSTLIHSQLWTCSTLWRQF